MIWPTECHQATREVYSNQDVSVFPMDEFYCFNPEHLSFPWESILIRRCNPSMMFLARSRFNINVLEGNGEHWRRWLKTELRLAWFRQITSSWMARRSIISFSKRISYYTTWIWCKESHVDAWNLVVFLSNATFQVIPFCRGPPLPYFPIDNFAYGFDYTTGLA